MENTALIRLTSGNKRPSDRNADPQIDLALANQSNILVIGIIGAVGAGTSWSARVLHRLLARRKIDATIVTARAGLAAAAPSAMELVDRLKSRDRVRAAQRMQEIGDGLRKRHGNSFVASAMIKQVHSLRTQPGAPRVFICDSLRHPDEIKLLRMVYGDACWTLGTVCDLDARKERLLKKLEDDAKNLPDQKKVQIFIDRDEDDAHRKHGQHVAGAFELADYFVDTSPTLSHWDAPETELDEWPVTHDIGRFIDLILGARMMLRPTDAEQAMYHAYAARLGSACLSRQVGAALIDRNGQLLATGCNEVPRAGGGLYGQGEGQDEERERGRCHSLNGYCSNTKERNLIVDEILSLLEKSQVKLPEKESSEFKSLQTKLRKSRVGQLIEFSRSVHAEMDALISAARKGVSTVGGKLFVTTFPCHNCARHIVASGIDEVQFIEPYLKSKALTLHSDAITQKRRENEMSPSVARQRGLPGPHRVLFRPYVGAAPRLYRRAFVQDTDLKDGNTGEFLPHATPGPLRLRPLTSGFEALEIEIVKQFAMAPRSPSRTAPA